MRTAFALAALTGCRSILGIEDVTVDTPSDTNTVPSDINADVAPADGAFGCPPAYVTLPNAGPRNHRYRLIDTARVWTAQRDVCLTEGGFLAFPDGPAAANELSAIFMLGGTAWIGINDIQTEGSYRNSLNQLISTNTAALLTMSGNSIAQDCISGSTSSMMDDDCNAQRKAVCECVP